MASAEHEPITGVWGQSPQRGPGAEHFGHWMSNGAGKFSTSSWKEYALLRSTGVRAGKGAECSPTPSLGGLCPQAPPPMGKWRLCMQWESVCEMCLSYVDWIHLAVPFCLLIVPSTIHTAAALLFTHACTPVFDKTSATTQNNIKIHVFWITKKRTNSEAT